MAVSFGDQFNYEYYLCVQVVPVGTLLSQKSLIVPYDRRGFNYLNQVESGFMQYPSNLNPGTISGNLQVYRTYGGNLGDAPLFSYNQLRNPVFGEDLHLIFMQVEEQEGDFAYSALISLNYKPMTREQFLWFKDTFVPTDLNTLNMRLWQIDKDKFNGIIKTFTPDNGTQTTVITFTNPRDVVQGLAKQLFTYSIASYNIEFSLLNDFWGIQLYDPLNIPAPPSSLASNTPILIAQPLLTTSSSLTNNWRIPTPQWYRMQIYTQYSLGTNPLITQDTQNPVFSITNGVVVRQDGLLPGTAYGVRGRTEILEVSPQLFSPITVVASQTTAGSPP